jgi:glycosyltransferase involved in cell wall biosynthesis
MSKTAVGTKRHILLTSAWFPSEQNTNGIFVKEQAEALCRSGHRVTVLIVTVSLIRPWLRSFFSKVRARYETSELLTIIRKHIVFPLPARLFTNPKARVKQYIINRVCNRMKTYFAVDGRPDLIHHHCLSDNSYLAEGISKSFDIPYVFTEYSNYFTYAELNRFNWFETSKDHYSFVKNAAARIAATQIRARGYEKIFNVPFICIPNLVTDSFAGSLPKRSPDLPFTFICVAVLDHRKRQDILLKAFARVFKGDNVRLVLVGSGVLEEEYKVLSARLGLEGQVIFKGKRDRNEVRNLFDESHVGVLSSDQETFAIVLAEAMFRGIPVISTRSGGPEEVVTPETGLLVPTGDEIVLAGKMKEMYDHYGRYDPEKIRASAMRRYSEAAVVPQLERIYDQVCATPSVPVTGL